MRRTRMIMTLKIQKIPIWKKPHFCMVPFLRNIYGGVSCACIVTPRILFVQKLFLTALAHQEAPVRQQLRNPSFWGVPECGRSVNPPPLEEAERHPADCWTLKGTLEPSLARTVTRHSAGPPHRSSGQVWWTLRGFPSPPGLWERCDVSEEEEETNWPGSSNTKGSSSSSRHLRGGSEFVSIKER